MTAAADPSLDPQRFLDEEARLVFERFDNDTALALGLAMLEAARAQGLGVAIDISRGEQQLFHAALAGTSANNDRWLARKRATVRHFGRSSMALSAEATLSGRSLHERHALDPALHAAAGGAFPAIVRGVGPVGVVAVSGLPQEVDHRFVVEQIEAFLASGGAGRADAPA